MGKTIIVTGASRGIGFTIAEYLISKGHNVVVCARSEQALSALKDRAPKQVAICVGSLGDFSLAEKAVKMARDDFGRLDGLALNHAAVDLICRIADSNAAEWRENFDVNFFSMVAFLRAAIPSLRESKGRVVFTSSGAATSAYSTWGSYGSSKAALYHLNLTLAAEEPTLTTVSIRPGVVDTQMQDNIRNIHQGKMDPKDAEKFVALHKNGGLVRPDQPGHVIAKLTLDAPKELHGQHLK
ncbi:MAG: hypothetical protein Q9174_005875 [Haloplaca sp. 1 TL-2023]